MYDLFKGILPVYYISQMTDLYNGHTNLDLRPITHELFIQKLSFTHEHRHLNEAIILLNIYVYVLYILVIIVVLFKIYSIQK
jgi:hypothetical protein